MAANDVDYAGGKHGKPQRTKCQKICRAIYNPQKKEFFGRNCGSWAKIGVFYLVFYSCLAGFFAIMLVGFFSTLDEKEPTMTGMYSLIKGNPGMGFRPVESVESTLIKFNRNDSSTYQAEVDDIMNYLRENGYIDSNNSTKNVTTKDSDGKDSFDFGSIRDECGIDNKFGYPEGKPCVLLKINRVFGWEPQLYGNESKDLEEFTKKSNDGHATSIKPGVNAIGVSCEGENDGDMDAIGETVFYPETGFGFEYFPYRNAKNYRGPLVFVKFNSVAPGTMVQVWCRMWAQNIKNNHKNDKAGSVRFELLVDEPKK